MQKCKRKLEKGKANYELLFSDLLFVSTHWERLPLFSLVHGLLWSGIDCLTLCCSRIKLRGVFAVEIVFTYTWCFNMYCVAFLRMDFFSLTLRSASASKNTLRRSQIWPNRNCFILCWLSRGWKKQDVANAKISGVRFTLRWLPRDWKTSYVVSRMLCQPWLIRVIFLTLTQVASRSVSEKTELTSLLGLTSLYITCLLFFICHKVRGTVTVHVTC